MSETAAAKAELAYRRVVARHVGRIYWVAASMLGTITVCMLGSYFG